MKKTIFKLKFNTPVHIGNGSLNDSGYIIKADTLFSALCLEADVIEDFVNLARDGKFKLSDALPYVEDTYYLPKPMLYIQQEIDNYKLMKNFKYIPSNIFQSFLQGELIEADITDTFNTFLLGDEDVRVRVAVGGDPYEVGTYTFREKAGLYIIVEYEDEKTLELLKVLFDRLQYSGIGGKRSSGFGSFTYTIEKFEETIEIESKKELGKYMLLNGAMTESKTELEKIISDGTYFLQKRSGFINGSQYKKQDLYTFVAGSTFNEKFQGQIFDLGNDEHPVYCYAIPMFMEV